MAELEELIKQIGDTIQNEANAKAVFGDPIKLDNHTIVPVAVINVGFGGGGATRAPEEKPAPLRRFFGAGGGMGLQARPVGFIHEKDGQVVFTPIHVEPPNAGSTVSPFVPPAVAGVIDGIVSRFRGAKPQA